MSAKNPNFEVELRKLKKIENRARALADMRDANERKWDKQHDILKSLPEFKEYCKANGISEGYDYGDIIC